MAHLASHATHSSLAIEAQCSAFRRNASKHPEIVVGADAKVAAYVQQASLALLSSRSFKLSVAFHRIQADGIVLGPNNGMRAFMMRTSLAC